MIRARLNYTMITRFYDYSYLSNKTLNKLRELTINKSSGMNYVLDSLSVINDRKPKAKIICCYDNGKIVGWLLATREKNKFFYDDTWNPKNGYWIQVFVSHENRNKGIATKLIDKYNKKIKTRTYFATFYKVGDEFGVFSKLKKGYSIY